ncbi:MAG: bifunctional diguanylate cyclase/phosphodiesterase [Pyrinomonadaceae bacterium]|nr:bifunctional diguanylate cyclase/phosphodiesterase [Pyrinomonadaceae bacterium]
MWKQVYLSTSVTQIAGATLTAIVYYLYQFADVVTSVIAVFVFAIIYINYRQMFRDINDSIHQVELAEQEKAEIANQQIQAAQEHAQELEVLLEKEEKISTDLRQSKVDLEHAAFHDNLTDLPNRAYLIERLDLLLRLGVKVSQNYYVLFLDLSRFKNINDSLGHTIGDEVLKVVALRLRRTLRDEDTAARLGGDEFAIVLNDIASLDDARDFANKVYKKLTQPFTIQGHTIFSDLHIGIAPFDSEQIKPEDVLRDADIAMQNAKENNIGVAVFDKDVRSEYLEHIRLEGDLRYACDRGEFSMHYQPLICLRTGDLMGFEALLRWQHPELGFISPARFIPICEDSGAIVPITNWILHQTTAKLAEWQKISSDYRKILVSVNISGKHLADQRLVSDVKEALDKSGLKPSSLKLEITETTAMENAERTIEVLQELKSLGVHISIDDFGTGYSSLSYLHRLPFDTLKIDRSFVINVVDRNKDTEILQTIIALTKNLKKEVIAEGIETTDQLKILIDLGCDYGQGYLFSRPLPVADMETELYKKKDWLPHKEEEGASEPDVSDSPYANLF